MPVILILYYIVWGGALKKQLYRYKSHLLFLLYFTLVFILVKNLFLYLLPFIVGISVTFVMYPVYKYMKKRLSFKPAFSATVITLFIFSVILTIVFYISYLIIRETIHLYNNNIEFFNKYIKGIDFSKLIKELSIDSDIFSKLSDTAFSIVRIVPLSITLLIISFVCTVCFINNLPKIKSIINSKLPNEKASFFNNVINNASMILKKFIRSYLLLYLLTFIESIFIFSLIDMDYVLVFAFLATVSDLLPILGPGTVYLPIAAVKMFTGDFLSGISLVIFWAIVIIIRQILEPKIVSDTIKIHPLVIFSAVYFSFVSSNIWVLFYITLLGLIYKILVQSRVLSPLFEISDKISDKES